MKYKYLIFLWESCIYNASNILDSGNKWDTINGQNIPIQTKEHECNSKPDKYKGFLNNHLLISIKMYIYYIVSFYTHTIYRYPL